MTSTKTGVAWADGFYVAWWEGKRYVHNKWFATQKEAEDGAVYQSKDSPFGDFICYVTEGIPWFGSAEGGRMIGEWAEGRKV